MGQSDSTFYQICNDKNGLLWAARQPISSTFRAILLCQVCGIILTKRATIGGIKLFLTTSPWFELALNTCNREENNSTHTKQDDQCKRKRKWRLIKDNNIILIPQINLSRKYCERRLNWAIQVCFLNDYNNRNSVVFLTGLIANALSGPNLSSVWHRENLLDRTEESESGCHKLSSQHNNKKPYCFGPRPILNGYFVSHSGQPCTQNSIQLCLQLLFAIMLPPPQENTESIGPIALNNPILYVCIQFPFKAIPASGYFCILW